MNARQSSSPTKLPGHQLRFLKGKAHSLRPVVMVGQNGVTKEVIQATDAALLQHELIKVRLLEPEDKRACATELAQKTQAQLCGLVGHTVILYRRHPEDPRIVLPPKKPAAST